MSFQIKTFLKRCLDPDSFCHADPAKSMRIRNTGIIAEMVLTCRMLNKKLTMKDIESIDPEFFNSLVWIRQGLVII
jgi:hypothetical protein